VMGPWFHGGWAVSDGESLGRVRFGSKTSLFYREQIEFPFFCRHLKDREDPKLPEAYMFETGANEWRRFDAWPPKNVARKALYFHPGGKLSFVPPTETAAAFDEYVSNPAKPVPYIAGQSAGMTREHMVDDQRFAASRPDVLSYRTEPLEADLTIAGEIRPDLRVSTTGTDSDWVVKLIDVYPDDAPDPTPPAPGLKMGGFQQMLRGECMRGRFRNSYEKPEPFEPGKLEKVEYPMPDVLHTFKKGHRIMVQVQSSWFPLVDRNPQKYVDIYQATEADFQTATQRVYRYAGGPSSVGVQVLN
jgi:putative CocE/NonD family hydrolase